jgi:hypothetical protein
MRLEPAFRQKRVFCKGKQAFSVIFYFQHIRPVRATSQGGKAAIFTSSLQNARFATSHLLAAYLLREKLGKPPSSRYIKNQATQQF